MASEEEGTPMTPEEMNEEVLECSRYGDHEDLLALLEAGADVNYHDSAGNTGLHKAAANGHVECLKVLKSFNAILSQNSSGNLPIHWAVQNQKLEAVSFFLENYELDVLQKNSFGRSVLTDAFQSGNTDIIEKCLSHSSSTEERLLAVDDPSAGTVSIDSDNIEEKTSNESNQVVHEFDFTPPLSTAFEKLSHSDSLPTDATTSTSNTSSRIRKTLRIRELPITRADNPFGSDTSPEDDTTGLGIWPSAVLMARYAVEMKELLRDQVVVELGCGCGIPGLAVAKYCAPKRVYLTDIHHPTLDNLHYNLALNDFPTNEATPPVVCQYVNWCDSATYPSEQADVIIGSDLVYDSNILSFLVPAVAAILKEGGQFLYVAPDFARAGMADLVSSLAQHRIHCVGHVPAPESMFENPLASEDGDQFVLHFYDLSAKSPHSLFHFVKSTELIPSNANSSLPPPPPQV